MKPGSAAPRHSDFALRNPMFGSVARSCVGVAALLFAAAMAGCDSGPAPSLYDPDRPSGPDPAITSIEPAEFALAGVDIVTLAGSNFSADAANNLVYFNEVRAEVAEASPTSLKVKAPATPGADIEVRVSVLGAENYSNGIAYRLEAAVESFGDVTPVEEPVFIASDPAGNLYVSMRSGGSSAGVIRIAPDGARSQFVETTFTWRDMLYGADDMLYAVRGVRAVFRFMEGGRQQVWVAIPDNSVRLSAMTFDPDNNMWAGGNNENIYRIAPDKSVEAFPFEANVRALRFFGGYLYAAATRDNASGIWRWPVTGGQPGEAERYFDVTGASGAEALALAFAANGDLFVGTNAADPVLLVESGGEGSAFYPGLLLPAAASFAWGVAPNLYMVQGRTDTTTPDLIRINTRREGAR